MLSRGWHYPVGVIPCVTSRLSRGWRLLVIPWVLSRGETIFVIPWVLSRGGTFWVIPWVTSRCTHGITKITHGIHPRYNLKLSRGWHPVGVIPWTTCYIPWVLSRGVLNLSRGCYTVEYLPYPVGVIPWSTYLIPWALSRGLHILSRRCYPVDDILYPVDVIPWMTYIIPWMLSLTWHIHIPWMLYRRCVILSRGYIRWDQMGSNYPVHIKSSMIFGFNYIHNVPV